jgi:hypothetical protein
MDSRRGLCTRYLGLVIISACFAWCDVLLADAQLRGASRRTAAHARRGNYARVTAAQNWGPRSELHTVHVAYSATLVTALYDIDRATAGDGRQMSSYVQWLQKTLRYNGAMVVFVGSSEHAETIVKLREGQPTMVIVGALEELEYYKLRGLIRANQKSEKWMRCANRGRLENKLDLYVPLVFNKFPLLHEAAGVNPFDSTYFIWVDAGRRHARFQSVLAHWGAHDHPRLQQDHDVRCMSWMEVRLFEAFGYSATEHTVHVNNSQS